MKKSRTRATTSPVEMGEPRRPAGDGERRTSAQALAPDERKRLIAEAAYQRAQQRGFVGGDPVTDWLEAEREIDQAPGARRQQGNA